MQTGDPRGFVQANAEAFLAEYQRFCRIPSVSTETAACESAAQWLAEALSRRGAQVTVTPTGGNPILYAEVKGRSERALLLYSHYDVVPVGDVGRWTFPPFGATQADGRIWGRGTADHKGSIMSRIQALDFFGPEGPPCTLKFLIEGNEEEGSPYLGEHVRRFRQQLQAEAALYSGWARAVDGTPRINGGGRGGLRVKLTALGPKQSLHGSYTPIAPNATLRLMRALDTLWDKEGRVAVTGFYAEVEPFAGELKEALLRMPINLAREAARMGVPPERFPTAAEFVQRLYLQPTISLYRFEPEGSSPSTVPASVSAWLNVSLVPNQRPEAILARLRDHFVEMGFADIAVAAAGPLTVPVRSPLNARVWDVVREAAEAVYGRQPVSVPLSSGSGPRYLITETLKIPIIADVGVSHAESNDHSYDENIYVDHYLEGVEHMIEIFRRW